MTRVRIGVVGASGYSGAVATRLLSAHPSFELVFCTSDKWVGRAVALELGLVVGGPAGSTKGLAFAPNGDAEELAGGADVVFLATGAEVSARLAPPMLAAGKKVVDFSGAFRLADAAAYLEWYGFTHPAPSLLDGSHYGLPEVTGAPPAGTRLVANPGCYPTATLLALAPLLREGLIEPTGIIVDAKSGVSGAGRQAREEYSFGEVAADVRAYKLFRHQHTPEIARILSRVAPARLTFTAHLLPTRRGLLATCYARPRPGATDARVKECLADAYASTPFVRAVDPGDVTLKSVAGTNLARVGAAADDDVVIAVGAIDNLLKGAAGQAVQNLNLLYGLDETLGLDGLHRFAP